MKTVGKWKGIRHVEMAYEGRKDAGCSGLLSARARVSSGVEYRGRRRWARPEGGCSNFVVA